MVSLPALRGRIPIGVPMTEGADKQMKIERHFIAEMSIYKFGSMHDLVMEVHERGKPLGDPMRYYAHFKHAEIKEGGMLSGSYGDGKSEREAIDAYAKKISLRDLVIDAMTPERRELKVPRLA